MLELPGASKPWRNPDLRKRSVSLKLRSSLTGKRLLFLSWSNQKSSSFGVRLTRRSKTIFTEDNAGGECEQTVPTLHGSQSPDTTHEPLVMRLIQFPPSLLELYHPLSSSVWNPMAITLYQLEIQPVCIHTDTIMPLSTDPSSRPQSEPHIIFTPPLSCQVSKIFPKTRLWNSSLKLKKRCLFLNQICFASPLEQPSQSELNTF